MSKICFVSYEIYPTVKGGCGVFLANAARKLLSDGHDVIFLLDIQTEDFDQFNFVDRTRLPNHDHCRAYQLDTLAPHENFERYHFPNIFEYQSYRLYVGLQSVCELESPDMVEFFDYCGVAYASLNAKVAGLFCRGIPLNIRLHGSMELIDRAQPDYFHDYNRYVMYNLEHHALRMADNVLYPSQNYLNDAYLPYYEKWFGQQVQSQPPLVNLPPIKQSSVVPDIVLFYGRLAAVKGVDRFVDAAVVYLRDNQNPRTRFYLVGYDSYLFSNTRKSYKECLLEKVPKDLQQYFTFTGQLSRQELSELLPSVSFAVIPSYYESFCYAAHELYESGVPIILSSIPAFHAFFTDGQNAKFFDGTVADLADQMRQLAVNEELRNRIRFPHPVANNPLGDLYRNKPDSTWIQSDMVDTIDEVLIVILANEPTRLLETLDSIQPPSNFSINIVVARPTSTGDHENGVQLFLGKSVLFDDTNGHRIEANSILTKKTLLILEAGDKLFPELLPLGLAALARQKEISFFGGWKEIRGIKRAYIDCSAVDANIELGLFSRDHLNRFIIRTEPGRLLQDVIDPRTDRYGEVNLLWQINTGMNLGIVAPLPLISINEITAAPLKSEVIDFMVIRDQDTYRKARLTRYLLTLRNEINLIDKPHRYLPIHSSKGGSSVLTKIILWVRSSRINKWLDNIPGVKNALRTAAEKLHLLESKRK